MPAVMRLNKLGTFSMAQLGQGKSIIGDMMKSARKNSDNFEENLLKLVRTLPKVLKFLPSDKAQDARNFVTSLQYWTGGNSENLQSFLLNITKEYVPQFKGVNIGDISEPELFPESAIWHPMGRDGGFFEDIKEYLNWCAVARTWASASLTSSCMSKMHSCLQKKRFLQYRYDCAAIIAIISVYVEKC
jgi:magnesium chelatase subunit H